VQEQLAPTVSQAALTEGHFNTAAAQPVEQHPGVTFNIWCLWSGVGIHVLNYVCWVNVFLLRHDQLAPVVHRQQQKSLHYLQTPMSSWCYKLAHSFDNTRQASPQLPPPICANSLNGIHSPKSALFAGLPWAAALCPAGVS